MTLKEFVHTLDERKQCELALELAQKAKPIWDKHATANTPEYKDSIVGLQHTVEKDILARTLQIIKKSLYDPNFKVKEFNSSDQEFLDPIIALQDNDWDLPYSVSRTFYAVYNLLEKVSGKEIEGSGESLLYVSINQSIDAISIEKILSDFDITEILKSYEK